MTTSESSKKTPLLTIELGDLKDSGDELASFLSNKCEADVQKDGSSLKILSIGVAKIRVKLVRTYLKKFLHQKGLRDEVRVLLKGKAFTFQPREKEEEEG